NTADPGLVVAVSPTSGGLGFDLPNAGNSTTFGLFDIWTDETSVNADDRFAKPINVNFTFTSPAATGNVGGNTLGGSLLGIFQFGRVVWGGPLNLLFGDGGQLRITLSDETFNFGIFGLTPGHHFGATVKGKFDLVQAPAPVPLPAALPLFASACGALGVA